MKKYMRFYTLNSEKTPTDFITMLGQIPGVDIGEIIEDEGQIYVEFTYLYYEFSLHNPDGGQEYWFFYLVHPKADIYYKRLSALIDAFNNTWLNSYCADTVELDVEF
ncbi:MAG: hypothetical protein INQ03_08270 [Candidatus Heimdallarchaeota archaeon]|nr:hypothetical protein [Candidatus Heimdallarchaeota archaeon]